MKNNLIVCRECNGLGEVLDSCAGMTTCPKCNGLKQITKIFYENIMVDLETLGKRAGCSILSIGAVKFDLDGLGEGFYVTVNRLSCKEAGLFEDPDTISWWDRQSDEAKVILKQVEEPAALHLQEALDKFAAFIGKEKIWGNGSDFDNAILYACYAAVDKEVPWKFWDSRCYRTLKGLFPDVKLARVGTYHNALDDAKSQALHAIEIMKEKKL
ncbi:MAG TPA: 3'-5' exonuclease [Dehalococcoidia bacterium]|nr:3'-5' exonuclease [Dehalococcoidia bacterium]